MPRKKRPLRFDQWISSYEAVREWMDQYDLLKLLEAGGGIVKISNFFASRSCRWSVECIGTGDELE